LSRIIPRRHDQPLDPARFLGNIRAPPFDDPLPTPQVPAIRQIAALPYRIDDAGHASVMLITSRETRRWVLPKGNLIEGLDWHQAAAHEAYEEAGITGIPCPTPIGEYRYLKRRRNGTTRDVSVAVFPLAFLEQAGEWPEQDERETRWFSLPDAAA
jgi:8-oxo-dGTP pyrophosphatase MutT (NUDIX family)